MRAKRIDRRAGRQAQGQRLFRRDRALGLADPFAARRAPARDHVLGEGRQLGEALLDPGGHEGARALATGQQALADQAVQGLAHGDARDAELLGHVAFGRQGVVGREDLLLDGFAQRALQLLVERRVILAVPSRPPIRSENIVNFAPPRKTAPSLGFGNSI
jgi:hypothetical protein